MTLAEVLATSDLPGGVVNILTGERSELIEHFASHMDVNAIIYCGDDEAERTAVRGQIRVKREAGDLLRPKRLDGHRAQNPYLILDTQEIKTTWHPIGI